VSSSQLQLSGFSCMRALRTTCDRRWTGGKNPYDFVEAVCAFTTHNATKGGEDAPHIGINFCKLHVDKYSQLLAILSLILILTQFALCWHSPARLLFLLQSHVLPATVSKLLPFVYPVWIKLQHQLDGKRDTSPSILEDRVARCSSNGFFMAFFAKILLAFLDYKPLPPPSSPCSHRRKRYNKLDDISVPALATLSGLTREIGFSREEKVLQTEDNFFEMGRQAPNSPRMGREGSEEGRGLRKRR
jgi:hypothetical protein